MFKRNKPYILNEEPGIKYYCACSKTHTPPYCDGSHSCTDIKPFEVDIDVSKTIILCGCGKSKNLPYCDRTHECLKL